MPFKFLFFLLFPLVITAQQLPEGWHFQRDTLTCLAAPSSTNHYFVFSSQEVKLYFPKQLFCKQWKALNQCERKRRYDDKKEAKANQQLLQQWKQQSPAVANLDTLFQDNRMGRDLFLQVIEQLLVQGKVVLQREQEFLSHYELAAIYYPSPNKNSPPCRILYQHPKGKLGNARFYLLDGEDCFYFIHRVSLSPIWGCFYYFKQQLLWA